MSDSENNTITIVKIVVFTIVNAITMVGMSSTSVTCQYSSAKFRIGMNDLNNMTRHKIIGLMCIIHTKFD